MDIKKTPIKDLHKIITRDYTQILKELKAVLGADLPLAVPRIGAGFYYWTAPGDGWRQANTEGALLFASVKQKAEEVKARIVGRFGPGGEKVMTYPDDSFLFFRDTNGTLEVMITGWGYRYPVGRKIDVVERDVPKSTPVRISFKAGGAILPDHPFSLSTPNSEKSANTDASGYYEIKGAVAGSTLKITDSWTGRKFERILVEGTQDYEFDITDLKPVTVSVTLNGAPLSGEPVKVNIGDKVIDAVTDGNGRAVVQAQYNLNQVVGATVRGEYRDKTFEPGGVLFAYDLTEQVMPVEPETPPAPQEGAEPAIIVKDPEGRSVAGWPLRVEIGGAATDCVSDANGIVALPFMTYGTAFNVTDLKDPSNVASYSLEQNRNEYDFMVLPDVEKISFVVIDNEDKPMHGTLALSQAGMPDIIVPLDQEGRAKVPASALRRGVDTRAIITLPGNITSYDPQTGQPVQEPGERLDPIQFTIDAGENEYVLQMQQKESSGMGWLVIFLIFLVSVAIFAILWIQWDGLDRGGLFGSLSDSLYRDLF